MPQYSTDDILGLAKFLGKDVFETCDGKVIDNDVDEFTVWDYFSHAHDIAIKLKLSTMVSDWANVVMVSDGYHGIQSSGQYTETNYEDIWNECVINVCLQILKKENQS